MVRLVQLVTALAIAAFWLHSMVEALRLERASTPKDIRVGRASYEILLARALNRDPVQYLGIYQGTRRIGHSYTEVNRVNTRYLLHNRTSFAPTLFAALPVSLSTQAESTIRIGPDFLIEQFTCDVNLGGNHLQARFEGHVEGNELVVTSWLPMSPEPQTSRLNRDLTLFNGLSPFVGIPQLDVGEEWTLQGLDVSVLGGTGLNATSFRPKVLTAKVLRKETLSWEGKWTEATVAALLEDPADPLKRRAQAWIAPDGKILMEEHRILNWTFTFKREAPPSKGGWRPGNP